MLFLSVSSALEKIVSVCGLMHSRELMSRNFSEQCIRRCDHSQAIATLQKKILLKSLNDFFKVL